MQTTLRISCQNSYTLYWVIVQLHKQEVLAVNVDLFNGAYDVVDTTYFSFIVAVLNT